jgi:hypothetical protein
VDDVVAVDDQCVMERPLWLREPISVVPHNPHVLPVIRRVPCLVAVYYRLVGELESMKLSFPTVHSRVHKIWLEEPSDFCAELLLGDPTV